MKEKNSRLVFSTDQGRVREQAQAQETPSGDGIVRIRRETKGRKGKGVTTISGIELAAPELKALAKKLKQLCGTGGAGKNGCIEIQGDHRETIKTSLSAQGFTVKLAGG